ncbi:MAG: 1,4-dihydroxy-2-naphthoate polyprenyltransferase [Alphaproteobacteria bacterium]|nr:1,4-dihydroxy-2-naphthoate polyprenyltransferase [Alphaproteobacteria bacterium]
MSSEARPSALKAWALATRPATLLAGATPVFVGTALAAADGVLAWGPALAALLGSLLIQIGTNLANDYFDFRSGADNEHRLGPARATQKGWITPRQVATGAAVVLLAAFAVGLYLVSVAGWPILVIGLVSIALAVLYTGGPYPLAYHGLGDLFVLVFFGFVAVGGTYWVQALTLTPAVMLAAAPIGLLATAILVVNNLRDRVTDAAANKRTLAVRFGARAARAEYAALLGLSFATPFVALALGLGGWGWLAPLLATPLAIRELRAIYTLDGAALNPHLGATARLELVFGALLCVGVLVG